MLETIVTLCTIVGAIPALAYTAKKISGTSIFSYIKGFFNYEEKEEKEIYITSQELTGRIKRLNTFNRRWSGRYLTVVILLFSSLWLINTYAVYLEIGSEIKNHQETIEEIERKNGQIKPTLKMYYALSEKTGKENNYLEFVKIITVLGRKILGMPNNNHFVEREKTEEEEYFYKLILSFGTGVEVGVIFVFVLSAAVKIFFQKRRINKFIN